MGDSQQAGSVDEKLFKESRIEPTREFTAADLLPEMVTPLWRSDPERQEKTLSKLALIWEYLDRHEQAKFYDNAKGHVGRLRREPEATRRALFDAIMELPSDSDIARALAYNPEANGAYIPAEWEKPYLDLPGFVGRFVDCYKDSHVPAPFFAWAALATLAIVSKYHVYVQTGVGDFQMNMFLFFVGDSSAGKSHAKDCMERLIHRLNRHLNTRLVIPAAPGQAPHIRVFDRPDLHINFLPEDGTGEAAIEAMSKLRQLDLVRVNKRGTGLERTGFKADAAACTYIDEVATHFSKNDWGVDKKIATYTSMFSKTTYSKATLGRGIQSYDHQAFSLVACGASEWFRGALSPVMLEGGFMDRSQFVYRPKSGRIIPILDVPVIDPIKEEALARELVALATPPTPLRYRVPITPGAKEALNRLSTVEFQHELDVSRGLRAAHEGYRRSVTRREIYRLKISALLAISDTPSPTEADPNYTILPITAKHVELAEFILSNEDRYFGTFLQAVNAGEDVKFARWLLNLFMRRNWEPVEQRFLLRKATRQVSFKIADKAHLDSHLTVLKDFGLIKDEMVKNPKKRGPASKFWVGVQNEKLWRLYVNDDQWSDTDMDG